MIGAMSSGPFPLMNRTVNPALKSILRSPLHRLASGRVALLTYTGRRSGREYTIPCFYRDKGDEVTVAVGWPERKVWWRNLTGEGSAVQMLIRGEQVRGHAVATRDPGRDAVVRVRVQARGSAAAELALELRRELPSGRETVFGWFTDPGLLAQWWGPAGFRVPDLELDPRPGGRYRIEMQPPEGESFFLGGEFRAVEPPEHLAFTFAYEAPDPDDVENLVRLDFRDLDGSTEIAFTQRPFETQARLDLHRAGWSDSFDRLEQLLSG